MESAVLTQNNTPKPTKSPAPSISFVYGPDDFLVNAESQKQINAYAAGKDLEIETINASAQTVNEACSAISQFIQALQSPSLFHKEKLVWLKDLSFLADSALGRAIGTKEYLNNLLEYIPLLPLGKTLALISASPVDRRTTQFKGLHKLTSSKFIETDSKDNNSLKSLATEEAQSIGVNFAPKALETLLEKINNSSRLLQIEIQKLSTYSPNSEITEGMIHELVPQFGESDFFEASEAFFSGNLEWALSSLNRHFFTNKEARPLLTSLQNRNRLLLQLKVLQESGELSSGSRNIDKNSLEAIAQKLNTHPECIGIKSSFNLFGQNPWYLNKLAETSRKFSLRQLMAFQNYFISTFKELLNNPHSQYDTMHSLFYKSLASK